MPPLLDSNTQNHIQFVRQIRAWVNNIPFLAIEFHQLYMVRAAEMVYDQTPKWTGLAAGEWQTSLGVRRVNQVGRIRTREEVLAEARSMARRVKPFSRSYLSNNVPYIPVLEYGLFEPPNPGPSKNPLRKGQILVRGGFSTQAPKGILGPVYEKLNKQFRDVLA